MGRYAGQVDTKDSKINREMGRTIARERAGIVGMTAVRLAEESGITLGTINRILSKDPRDINITQITWIAAALGTTPQELVAEAVRRAGGLGAIMAELRSNLDQASEAPATNDELERKRRQREAASMTTEQLEGEMRSAATRDPEMDTDEPPTT